MKYDFGAGRLIIFAVVTVLLLLSPGVASAKFYATIYGTVDAAAASATAINVTAQWSTGATSCGNGGDTVASFEVQWDLSPADWVGFGSSGSLSDPNLDSNSTLEYQITSLTCGTTYEIRVIYTDPDGVSNTDNAAACVSNGGSSSATVNDVGTVTTSACAAITTAPGTVTLSVISDTQINVTMPYTDNSDTDGNCTVEYNTADSWPGTSAPCSPVSGASPRTCNITTGLLPGTLYYVRVIYTDPDGISGGQPATQVKSATTTYTGLGVGTVTTGAVTTNSVVVNAPVDSTNSDTNSNATVQYQYKLTSEPTVWTNYGTAVAAKTNQSMNVSGLSSGTSYDFRVIWTDANGVYNQTTRASLGSPYTSNTATASTTSSATGWSTNIGTLTSPGNTDVTIDISLAYTNTNCGSGDTSATMTPEYRTPPGSGGWTTWTSGSAANGGTPYTDTITGLAASTQYEIRVLVADPDGVDSCGGGSAYSGATTVTTSAPSTCVSTITACSDCHGMPPADWDGVSAKTGTTYNQGDHDIAAHTGAATTDKCAVCHFDYAGMINVTSTARWGYGHTNTVLDVYTSNNVVNNIFSAPYDKGIKGGYYKGYRANSLIFDGNSPGANNVCTATYCHGAGDSPVWGTGSAACGSCHSVPPTAGKHGTHSQGYVGYKNNSNSTTYNFGCYKCHSDIANHASGPVSANRAALVNFDNLSTPTNPSGSYAEGSLAGTDGTFNWTNGTCNTTYCHSNGAGTNVTDPTWNGTLPANCTGCHNGNKAATPNIMATNGHTDHVNNADANLAAFGCVKCHNATVSSDTVIGNEANHVNGTKNVVFDSTNPSGGYDGAFNCSNLYCHSSGQSTPNYRTPPAWNSATNLTCNGCHGADNFYTDINGSPDYENISTTTRNTFNGHQVSGHVAAASDCIKCHNSTVDSSGAIKASSLHLDTSRDVVFALGGTYSNKRCSGTDSGCHGAVTPRWGGSLACEDCHFDTGSIGSETDDYTYGNATKATINETEWLNHGHGKTSGTYSWTGNSAANLGCLDCHTSAIAHNDGNNPFRLTSANPDTLCTGCHDGVTAVLANHHNSTNVSAIYPSANATWTFTPKCVDCHDPHGDTAGGVTPAEYNGAMIQRLVANSGSNTYGVPSGTPVNMDFPDDDPLTSADFNYASFQQNDFSGLCQVCHDASDNVANYNKTTNNTAHYAGQNKCTGCHKHEDGFGPSGGTCTGCHTGAQNGRPSMQTEFSKVSHHVNVAWASISDTTCEVCHLEGGSVADGAPDATYHNNNVGGAYPVDLRVIATVGANETATISNAGNQTAIQYFTGSGPNGGTKSAEYTANNFCMGCHDATNASSNPFSGSESGGSLKSPGSYDGSYGSIEARYKDTSTTTSHPFSPNTYNVVPNLTKAYSPHGNPQNNQMKNVVSGTWTNDSQTAANAIGCLDCHNSHGSDALADDGTNFNGITYSSAMGGYKGGLLKTTSTYDPDEATTYSAGSDLCFDCHLGDGGAAVPKTYTNFGVARTVHEYYDAGRWTSSSNWSPTFSYKTSGTGNGTASMKGSHFGASSALGTSAGHPIDGSCMACHDPHGTPTGGFIGTGTNRARMAPALKGTWMSSPYKEDRVATGTVTDTNTYGATIAAKGSGNTARIAPSFALNNPADLGAGFGTGAGSFGTYAAGGSGAGGYFIDDNTFGNSNIDSTAANPWGAGAITAYYITDAARGSLTDASFGGLCLYCHSDTSLKSLSYSNGTDTAIKVHNTVAGWYNSANATDLFKNTHANQHSMAYYTVGATDSNRCTNAYWTLPAGYRWSVNPGSQKSFTQSGWPATTGVTTITPTDNGGQTHITYKQTAFHQFPCAKCHAPHSSKLPRLMKTNCLDVGVGNVSEGGSPRHNSGYTISGCDDEATVKDRKAMICHGMGPGNTGAQNSTGNGGWNTKTGW